MSVVSSFLRSSRSLRGAAVPLVSIALLVLSACRVPPPPGGSATGPSSGPTTLVSTPLPREYRNPIQERTNALNREPVVANEGVFPEYEQLRSEYLIPESTEVARENVRAAARAFGAAVLYGVRNPQPSGLNMELPDHPSLVTLPAALNTLGRAAAAQRDGVFGIDVGPSVPDASGRVWVAVFMGASGPIGAVESVCVAVTLRSDGRRVQVDLEEVASKVVRQPEDRKDYAEVSCVVDLEARSDEGFASGL
jgi:hypothetical protein